MVLCEIDTPKYTVRVHSGKMTEAERNEVIRKAAEEFDRKTELEKVKRNDGS